MELWRAITLGAVGAGLVLGGGCFRRSDPPPAPLSPERQEELDRLLSVMNIVQQHFVFTEATAMTNLLSLALSGLARHLDGASQALIGEDAALEPSETWLAMPGPGWVAGLRLGQLDVLALTPGGAAEEAGVDLGDQLLAWEREPVSMTRLRHVGLGLDAPPAWAEVRLRHRGLDTEYRIRVPAVPLHEVEAVTSETIDPNLRLVRVAHAVPSWPSELVDALRGAEAVSASSVVLDLRSLASLDVEGAARVADVLLPEGHVLWKKLTRDESSPGMEQVAGGGAKVAVPVWVLIGPGTAGAGELLAAALAEGERAVLFGRPTRGLMAMTRKIDLDHGTALLLSAGWYENAAGQRLGEQGVIPDLLFQPGDGGEAPGDGDPLLARAIDLLRVQERFP